jgi:hypothetical protein
VGSPLLDETLAILIRCMTLYTAPETKFVGELEAPEMSSRFALGVTDAIRKSLRLINACLPPFPNPLIERSNYGS